MTLESFEVIVAAIVFVTQERLLVGNYDYCQDGCIIAGILFNLLWDAICRSVI